MQAFWNLSGVSNSTAKDTEAGRDIPLSGTFVSFVIDGSQDATGSWTLL
jgi:hypothetical protein